MDVRKPKARFFTSKINHVSLTSSTVTIRIQCVLKVYMQRRLIGKRTLVHDRQENNLRKYVNVLTCN